MRSDGVADGHAAAEDCRDAKEKGNNAAPISMGLICNPMAMDMQAMKPAAAIAMAMRVMIPAVRERPWPTNRRMSAGQKARGPVPIAARRPMIPGMTYAGSSSPPPLGSMFDASSAPAAAVVKV